MYSSLYFFPLYVSRIKYSRYYTRGCTNNTVGRGLQTEIGLKISPSFAFRLQYGIHCQVGN